MTQNSSKSEIGHGNKPLSGRIGLALGGGGVRGFAHIGVLTVLRREGIHIQAIAGSSMGAIVGTLFSLHYNLDLDALTKQLIEIATPVSEKMSFQKKEDHGILKRLRQFIHMERFLMDTIWGWGEVTGEVTGELFKKLTQGKLLEDCRIPVAVVTTDLLSGERVVFTEGPAHLALQASSALPGIFPPVRYQNRLLADGAFVDYVPVEVVRQMNVDKVIAVDVDQENLPVEINNGLEAMMRATELCARHHKWLHLENADVVIRPDFKRFVQTFDISMAQHCISAGMEAAEQALEKLQRES
ncbi:MAG: patatin-like phospholipase family protein [Calditrichaeota bacterium]|nr:patatin-like phospholipase family protein [Calditrichota bacterium]